MSAYLTSGAYAADVDERLSEMALANLYLSLSSMVWADILEPWEPAEPAGNDEDDVAGSIPRSSFSRLSTWDAFSEVGLGLPKAGDACSSLIVCKRLPLGDGVAES